MAGRKAAERRTRDYPVPSHGGPFTREMPQGAEVFTVHPNNKGVMRIWALVDPEAPPKTRHFLLVTNGRGITETVDHIKSFITSRGTTAHLFEVIEQPD